MGFVSEWLVYLGALRRATRQEGRQRGRAMPAAIMLAMAGALGDGEFCEGGRNDFPRRATHTGRNPRARMRNVDARAMLALAVVCVTIGLAPILFWPVVARVVGKLASGLDYGGSARAGC